ncbi:MAG: TetR/AcrR family transcriptional regulator C-terminal domain-containing protein [Candidatus Limnocylindria bacterium]
MIIRRMNFPGRTVFGTRTGGSGRGFLLVRRVRVAGLLKTRDPLGPHSPALAETFLLRLRNAGFPHREAGLAFFLILDYTIGFEVSSPRMSVNEQRVQDEATRKRLHEFFRSRPGDRFPTLIALGEHVWLDNRDERFAAGINALLDGLERARRPTPSSI